MKNKRKNNADGVNGYSQGYNYPAAYYNMPDYVESKDELKGSFWTPCSKKAKGRHSFCDGQ